MIREMDSDTVVAVRDRRARRTACGVVGPEHEMVDEELRAPAEEMSERCFSFVGLELIFFVDLDPRQFLTFSRQLIAPSREFFLSLEQLESGGEPLFTCSGFVFRHRFWLLFFESAPLFVRACKVSDHERRRACPASIPRSTAALQPSDGPASSYSSCQFHHSYGLV